MKKILTSVAMVLLLAGCAKQYDDSAIQTRIADLERRVTSLESSVDALRSTLGEGVFVAKVNEYKDPETQKVVGVYVTYTNGESKYFEITPEADYQGPVVSIIMSGSGNLVWAVDGIAIHDAEGKEIPVYETPVFTLDEDGFLWVEVNGMKSKLGQVKNEGATLVDGIFTDIKVEQDKVVLTLSDGTTVNVPFAEAFKLNIETTEFVFNTLDAIEIPYTVTAKTSGTVVGVSGYNPYQFVVKVEADKIVVTPLNMKAAANLLIYADSKIGLTSMVSVLVEAEGVKVVDDSLYDIYGVDYIAEGEDGVVEAHVVSNVEFDVLTAATWIKKIDVKGTLHTLTLTLEDNESGSARAGYVYIVKKGAALETLSYDDLYQSILIGQFKMPDGPRNLSKKGTANCYIVTAAGEYKIATVKGNSNESVGTVKEAKLLWETWNNQETVTANSVIASVGTEEGFITFSTPATLKPGNALIAAVDAEGVILWSWHIWIPETAITESLDNHYSVKNVMDRNLGALVSVPADAAAPVESFGLLYEWGRKDPFPGLGVTKGVGSITVAGIAMTKEPAPFTIEETIKNPTVYVRKNDSSKDWLPADTDAAVISSLWGETDKALYDPCPVGYMLPARNTACGFWNDEMNTKDYFVLDSDNCKYTVGTLIFPIAGYIEEGSENQKKAGTRTLVWSARWDSGTENGYGMYGYTDDGIKFKRSGQYRTRGGSVRCVAEAAAE